MASSSKTKAGGSGATKAKSNCGSPSKSKATTSKANASGSRTQLRPKGRRKKKNPSGQGRAKHEDLLTLRNAVLKVFEDRDWAKQGKEITLTNKDKAVASILLKFTLNTEKKPRFAFKSKKGNLSSPVPKSAPDTPLFKIAESMGATATEEQHELGARLDLQLTSENPFEKMKEDLQGAPNYNDGPCQKTTASLPPTRLASSIMLQQLGGAKWSDLISLSEDNSPEFPPGFEKPVFGPQVLQAAETCAPPVQQGLQTHTGPLPSLNYETPEVLPQNTPPHVTCIKKFSKSSKLADKIFLPEENASGSYCSAPSSDFPQGFENPAYDPEVQQGTKNYPPPMLGSNDGIPAVLPQSSPFHVTGINSCFNDAPVRLSSKLSDSVSLPKENVSGSYCSGTSSGFPLGLEKPFDVPQVQQGTKNYAPPMLVVNDGTPEVIPQSSPFPVTGNSRFNDAQRLSSKFSDSVSLLKGNASGSYCSGPYLDFPPGFGKPAYVPQLKQGTKNYAPPMLDLNDGTPEVLPQSSPFHVTSINTSFNDAPVSLSSKLLDSVSLQKENASSSYCSGPSSGFPLGFEKPFHVPQVQQGTTNYASPMLGLNDGAPEVWPQSSPFHVTGINTSFDNAPVLNSKLLDPIALFNDLTAGFKTQDPYLDFLLGFANPRNVPPAQQVSHTNAPPLLRKDLTYVPQVHEDSNGIPEPQGDLKFLPVQMQQSLHESRVLQGNLMHVPDRVLYNTHMLQETQAYPNGNRQEPLPSVTHLMSNVQGSSYSAYSPNNSTFQSSIYHAIQNVPGSNSMPIICGARDHEQHNVENQRVPTEVEQTFPAVAALNESMRESSSASNGFKLSVGGFLKLP